MAINDVPPGSAGAFEEIIITSSAAGLTASVYGNGPVVASKAVVLVLSVAANTARWCACGTTPTSVSGMPMFLIPVTASVAGADHQALNQRLQLNSPAEIAAFRIMTSAAVSATLHVTYYR